MQIYNILFMYANIFMKKFGVGPEGRMDILTSDA